MKPTRRQQWAIFKRDFSDLCRDWHGVESPDDAIGEGVAFRFETTLGSLKASIHAPVESLGDYRHARRLVFCLGSIYMQFDPCTGPAVFPLSGDFNRFSHKWNIHITCDDPKVDLAQSSMMEFYRRLSALKALLLQPEP